MMASGGFGSRKQDAVLGSENVTAIDGATVVQALPAMNAPQKLVKQMYAGPNSALPQRLGVAGALQEDARCATSNLITGVPKQGGMPPLGQPQISPQRRFPPRQQAVINKVLQVQKEAEDSDRILYSNQFDSNKRRRDEGLQVVLKEMLSNSVETEKLLIQQAETLTQKYEKVVTEMQVAAKEAETLLVEKHKNVVTKLQDAAKGRETLHNKTITEMQVAAKEAVAQHNKIITGMQVSAGEAERLHNKIVTKMQADARKEAEKYKNLLSRMEEERQNAARKLVERNKGLLNAQVDAHKKDEKIKYDKVINRMHELRKEAEKVFDQEYKKLHTQVEEARKENEEHKREIRGRKEREKEMLQKQSNLKAEVEKQCNMYLSALTSYDMAKKEQTSAEKVHAEAKRAFLTQLEYLESQLSALKEERITLEKEHQESKHAMVAQVENLMSQLAALTVEKSTLQKEHEECKQARMNAKLESVESRLPREKQGVTTVGKDVREMQLHLAQLEEDKIMLQKALDALKGSINSEVDRGSIELLWEVVEKVLTLPEDVRACQSVHYASGYDTLLSTREENNVDMMMSFVHAALNEAAKNWKIAQADVEKMKWSCRRRLVDAVIGRTGSASETAAPPRDIPNHALEYIPDDPENESIEEHPHKKRKPNCHLQRRNHRQFVAGR